jgi:hypothetical protein
MDSRQPPEPTELVYIPRPSWVPAIAAFGLTLVVVGLISLWVYSVVGGVIFLLALRSWIRETSRDVSRLPGEQRPATAVLPVAPPRREPRS